MKHWRIVGLVVLAAVAVGLVLRSFNAPPPAPPVKPPPPRVVFHASKPLRIEVVRSAADTQSTEWLERELAFVLARGKMRSAARNDRSAYVLRIELPDRAKSKDAVVSLLAPDAVMERTDKIPLDLSTRLATVHSVTSRLPAFLGAATATDWNAFTGTADADVYEKFLVGTSVLLDSKAKGFTQPVHSRELARSVEQLEALARQQPRFARAQSLLAIGYLALGGEDQSSLTQIADAAAKRALTLDDELADAHGAMGLARLRRGEWIAAKERFDAALDIDVNDLPALEGLACLYAEAGQMTAALPIAEHALAMQPGNVGASECHAYARIAAAGASPVTDDAGSKDLPVARVDALATLLAGDPARAERTLTGASDEAASAWIKPLLRASADRSAVPEALRAITRAAGDGQIDAATEVMCGAALRQSDFVFNRMSRLQKQKEAVPLRILWLPQTQFLRQNRRFEQIVTAVDLTSYWQEHGRADICEKEPEVYGCKLRPSPARATKKTPATPAR